MIRRFNEPIRNDVYYRPRPGAYGVLLLGNKVLITFQSQPDPEFQLPGGGVDSGETPIVALHREIREETGWAVKVERRLGAFQRYAHNRETGNWNRKVCQIYLCRPIRKKWEIIEPSHSTLWVSPAEAAAILTNKGDQYFMRSVVQA